MQKKDMMKPQRNAQNQGSQGRKQAQQKSKPKIFDPYWPEDRVSDGIKRGELFVGPIRINQKNYMDAYVPHPDGKTDVYIQGMENRNRALNYDEVVVQVNPSDKWRVFTEDVEELERLLSPNVQSEGQEEKGPLEDSMSTLEIKSATDEDAAEGDKLAKGAAGSSTPKANTATASPAGQRTPVKKFTSISDMKTSKSPFARNLFNGFAKGAPTASNVDSNLSRLVQQTGKVIYIYKKKHSRAASGFLKQMQDRNKNLALFSPMDSRVSRIIIPIAECPKDFNERPGDYSNTLYIARIKHWEEHSKMPFGTLARSLGEAGEIEPETEALLMEMDVDDSPFSDQVLQCLPQDLPWSIPQSEFAYRKDLRKQCIFTIDPATARDLDDAVSIEETETPGIFEIGVHIADVSHFVQESTELDKVAAKRATSVYLVQKVVPMLPRLLCEELCSLNPDEDRLAFSVMWRINQDGEIHSEWYGRSVIRSCVKLSYEHAQGFIDEPEKEWTQDELPPITNSFQVADIKKRVLQLNKIAVALRKQRFDNGALRLDQVKLMYSLNKESGMPNGYSVYQQKDSNRLIEEYMLLANMAVAHKIYSSFPEKAILRRHPSPQAKPLEAVKELCEGLGLEIDSDSAGRLQNSLRKYGGEDDFSIARLQVLIVLISKPMQNARYFCTGTLPDQTMYHHYALNVPLYTHFTSPIRRYPDILVHRLLAAAIDYSPPTEIDTAVLQREAEHCNDKKLSAKMASDRSSDMYFSIFVKEAGPLEEQGMVMAILDKSFDVLVLKLGVVKRVYLENLPVTNPNFQKHHKIPELIFEWPADDDCNRCTKHKISLFTVVDCCLFANKEPLRWSCVIRRPSQELKFQKSANT